MSLIKSSLLILFFAFSFYTSEGQQVPLNPVSYRIFSPFVFNPAMAGSKDYTSINFIAGFQEKPTAQMLTGESRLGKKSSDYFSAKEIREFSNVGIGGSFFNELDGSSGNMGGLVSLAYHFPLNRKKLNFLSFGAAFKGVYNTIDYADSGDSLLTLLPPEKSFYPNLDLGVYYYGTNFYAGFSSTNLLGNPGDPDSIGNYLVPVSRQYFFTTGYKILLSRAQNIILEPSIIMAADDSTYKNLNEIIQPLLKLYLKDFCVGTYYNNKTKLALFFQFRYPRLSIGALVELPKKSAYYKDQPILEFTLGYNFSSDKFRVMKHSRW
jgi:type IX secretion system PorP/SprF family membrane protein